MTILYILSNKYAKKRQYIIHTPIFTVFQNTQINYSVYVTHNKIKDITFTNWHIHSLSIFTYTCHMSEKQKCFNNVSTIWTALEVQKTIHTATIEYGHLVMYT